SGKPHQRRDAPEIRGRRGNEARGDIEGANLRRYPRGAPERPHTARGNEDRLRRSRGGDHGDQRSCAAERYRRRKSDRLEPYCQYAYRFLRPRGRCGAYVPGLGSAALAVRLAILMRGGMNRIIVAAVFFLFTAAAPAYAARLKDIADVEGVRPNQLIGYG